MEEFDPLHRALRTTADYQQEILDLFDIASNKKKLALKQTPWAIGSFLRGWQMDVPKGHPFGADPKEFLKGSRPQIYNKLKKEIRALNGVMFQLALKVQLQKTGPDGKEEYTDSVLRHKQEVLLQRSTMHSDMGSDCISSLSLLIFLLDKAIPTILETLGKWTQRGSGWVINQVRHSPVSAPERQLL